MKTYSFTYYNIYGFGDVVEIKDFETDSEAMANGRDLIEFYANEVASRETWRSDFQSPSVTIDKWENGYPNKDTFGTDDEVEPIATADIVAEFSDKGEFIKYITYDFESNE